MSTPTTPSADEEFTELRDARIGRVDLVDKAANGMSFLIAKSADGTRGLMDPALVRDLIGKSQPQPEPETAAPAGEQVTMTGSPAAIARLIHEAAVAKTADPDGSPADPAPAPASPEQVVKDAGEGADMAAMDIETPLAEPDGDAPGDPNSPGSPAWEAIDAATARKWTGLLARARHAVSVLAEREMLEAASADPDDIGNAFDLEDACCALDYAISVLAPFAVSEQVEADTGEMAAVVGKAVAALDPAHLDTIEALTHVAKAGRVLSTSNENAIRGAVEQLQKVLASLPAPAPDPSDTSGQAVAKEATVPETTTAPAATPAAAQTPDPAPAAAAPAAPVRKADQAPQVAVYDQKGQLVGIADPADIVPIAAPEPEAGTPAAEATDPAAAEPAAAAADLEPAPAAAVGTPADAVPDDDGVTKTTAPDTTAPTTDTPSDAESSTTDVTKSPDGTSATQQEPALSAAEIAELVKTVEVLKGQVRALEEQPAESKVFTNGAAPTTDRPQPQLRGQDRGAAPMDIAKAQQMKKGLYGAADATEQNAIATDMQAAAIQALAMVHGGGSVPQQ